MEMKFFKFLKNINRGIALLIAVVIGFAGYVVYDYAAFAKEAPEIEAFSKEYTLKIASMTVLPEEENRYQNVSENTVKKKAAQNNQILDQYWTTTHTISYYPGKQSVKNQFETLIQSAIQKDPRQNGVILDTKIIIEGIRNIKKTSPSTAEAEVEFMIIYRYQGNPWLYVAGLMPANEKPISDSKVRCFKNKVGMHYGLFKTENGWKISWESGFSYGVHSITVEEE